MESSTPQVRGTRTVEESWCRHTTHVHLFLNLQRGETFGKNLFLVIFGPINTWHLSLLFFGICFVDICGCNGFCGPRFPPFLRWECWQTNAYLRGLGTIWISVPEDGEGDDGSAEMCWFSWCTRYIFEDYIYYSYKLYIYYGTVTVTWGVWTNIEQIMQRIKTSLPAHSTCPLLVVGFRRLISEGVVCLQRGWICAHISTPLVSHQPQQLFSFCQLNGFAFVICIKREAARGSSGFLSGWYFKESCR